MGSTIPEKEVIVETVPQELQGSQPTSPGLKAEPTFDHAAEKKLVRKLDIRILGPLTFIFFFSFIDRVNIAFARIQGLEKDLHMHGSDFNVALVIFFAPFVVFEVPSNLILRKVRPSIWLGSLSLLWGITTIAQGVITTYHGLVAMRFFLGLFEAGLVPGAVYLTSMYYKRHELQWRLSLLYVANIVAIAFGGLLAYAIAHMNGVGGYSAWRWIFIIEGMATVVVSLGLFFFIADWPETARFLNPAEKQMIVTRLQQDMGEIQMNRLDRKAVTRIVGDWKIWVSVVIYFGVSASTYTTLFIPTILVRMGYTAVAAQAHSIPIFVVSATLALGAAYFSDRLAHRFSFCFLGVILSSIAYIILLLQTHVSVGVQYFSLFFLNGGCFMILPVLWVWLSNNMGGHLKRSVSAGAQIGFGSAGGIVPSLLFVSTNAPLYKRGFWTCFSLMLLAGLGMIVFLLGLMWENKVRARGGRDYRLEFPAEEVKNLGDDHPDFRFTY
ncbi:hypothetical protein MMC25_003528 [Agyrium rufum]|nr:hypothetical protein [Agyrium rufum]